MAQDARILVVDDDPAMRSLLSFRLEDIGYEVVTAESGEEVLEMMEGTFSFDLVISDVMLPGINGNELIQKIKQEYSEIQVIVMTAYPSLKLGVECIKSGAFDFICKPFDIEQLLKIATNSLENLKLKRENRVLRQTLTPPSGFSDLIGKSSRMQEVRKLIRQSAASKANVLLSGKSGTGKEVVAHTIHKNSPFHQSAFVVVNCGAIPANLIESELFGYEKGAFTGAVKQTRGKFEQANNGTIFLDEIGELPLEAQVKLLRVLQDKTVTRLGGDETIKLNFRLIAATNRNLVEMVREGTFREDLYYRLALFLIELPSLDERGSDKLLLAEHFLSKYAEIEERATPKFTKSAQDLINAEVWPGNVRQLENCIHRSLLMHPDQIEIDDKHLQFIPSGVPPKIGGGGLLPTDEIVPMRVVEAHYIENALRITRGNVQKAAKMMELSRVTLYRKMKEYDIQKP